MEQLVALVYTSKAHSKTDLTVLCNILKTSQSLNVQDQITGFLSFRENIFLQLLEGPKSKVMECFERIKNDQRHSQITVQGICDIDHRSMPDWSMGIINSNGLGQPVALLSLFESGRAGKLYNEQKSLIGLLKMFIRGSIIKLEPNSDSVSEQIK